MKTPYSSQALKDELELYVLTASSKPQQTSAIDLSHVCVEQKSYHGQCYVSIFTCTSVQLLVYHMDIVKQPTSRRGNVIGQLIFVGSHFQTFDAITEEQHMI